MKLSPFVLESIRRTRKDFTRETFFCGGKGGQKQNKTETGVRITDNITGIACEGREHRTQRQNQHAAMRRMKTRLISYYQAIEAENTPDHRVNTRIRTYNEKRGVAECDITGASVRYKDALDGKIGPLIQARLEHDAKFGLEQ